tara:strand:+ start:1224 stop:1340 length:117 start_codon:yes stop_codon:yes gene_type:complete
MRWNLWVPVVALAVGLAIMVAMWTRAVLLLVRCACSGG